MKEIAKIIVDGNAEEIKEPYEPKEYNHRRVVVTVTTQSVDQYRMGFGLAISEIARNVIDLLFTIKVYENGSPTVEIVHGSQFDLYSFGDEEALKEKILRDIKHRREFSVQFSSSQFTIPGAEWIDTYELVDPTGVFKWLIEPKKLAQFFYQITMEK